jgi:branched-chain amino acid transport system permease protein
MRGRTKAAISAAFVIVLALLPVTGVLTVYYMHILIGVFLWVLVACSLRLLGLSGLNSIGHAGFMSIGAYVSGILAKYLGWSPWIAMPIGMASTIVVAYLVAIPFTRVRGIYFTMVSLFFSIGAMAVIQVFNEWTGGYSGLGSIPPLFGYPKQPYFYFCLFILVICLAIMYRMEHSRIGLTWKAVAQSHEVASSIGIDESGQRIQCLTIGCLFAGIAGAVYAHYFLVITQETFSFNTSINVFVYMMVGGMQQFAGPIVGTAVLLIIPELARDLKEYVPFVFAAILLITLFAMPQGLAGLPDQCLSWYRRTRVQKSSVTKEEVLNRAP